MLLRETKLTEVILASSSPRRKELLSRMGVAFTVCATDTDETIIGEPTPRMVLELAARKARAAALALRPQIPILAADTIVWVQGRMLGKPKDANEAVCMLRTLSGCWHEVYTGVCVLDPFGREESLLDCTRVHFLPLSEDDMQAYIATGEPFDKAGAYGIQGMAGRFIDAIEGSDTNVMGLPMAKTWQLLKRFA